MAVATRTMVLGAILAAAAGSASAQSPGAPYAGGGPGLAQMGPDDPYLAPARGMRLDPIFLTPAYFVRDERAWGLPMAPTGLNWVRYYDDAVLVDRDGVVREVRGGLDWEGRASYAPAADPRIAYDSTPFDPRYSAVGTPLDRTTEAQRSAYWERHSTYRQPPRASRDGYAPRDAYAEQRGYDPRCFAERRDNTAATVGGAVAGAVVGGIAGNLIAGRGDGTAGTLIGGGLGAVAGGVAGRALGRAEGGPIGPCPDDYSRSRGYGTAPIASGYAPGTQVIGYLPGSTTVTTITFDDGTTTTTYADDEE